MFDTRESASLELQDTSTRLSGDVSDQHESTIEARASRGAEHPVQDEGIQRGWGVKSSRCQQGSRR